MPSVEPSHPKSAAKAPFLFDLLLGYVLLGLQPVTVGQLSRHHFTPSDAVFLRFTFGAAAIVLVCLVRGRGLRTGNPAMLFVRGALGAGSALLYFMAVSQVGAARATLLNYTYPLWANVFSWFLGARPPARFWAGMVVAACGVWLIVVPEGGFGVGGVEWGDLVGLLSGILAGASVHSIKRLRETDESLTILASFTVMGLAMSFRGPGTLEALGAFAHPISAVTVAAWGVGVTSFLGHFYFTRGYGGASIEQATLLSLIVPLVAAATGALFFGEALTLRFLCGAVLVMGALSWVMLSREGLRPRSDPHKSP